MSHCSNSHNLDIYSKLRIKKTGFQTTSCLHPKYWKPDYLSSCLKYLTHLWRGTRPLFSFFSEGKQITDPDTPQQKLGEQKKADGEYQGHFLPTAPFPSEQSPIQLLWQVGGKGSSPFRVGSLKNHRLPAAHGGWDSLFHAPWEARCV